MSSIWALVHFFTNCCHDETLLSRGEHRGLRDDTARWKYRCPPPQTLLMTTAKQFSAPLNDPFLSNVWSVSLYSVKWCGAGVESAVHSLLRELGGNWVVIQYCDSAQVYCSLGCDAISYDMFVKLHLDSHKYIARYDMTRYDMIWYRC